MNHWQRYFLRLALLSSGMSKDPNTRCGAVIVDSDKLVRATGYNGFPRGVLDHAHRLAEREVKNAFMVHAEHNAILSAARAGTKVAGCVLYFCATDDTGMIWGGPPCLACTLAIIQTGIVDVVSLPFKNTTSAWRESVKAGAAILREAGVSYTEVEGLLE